MPYGTLHQKDWNYLADKLVIAIILVSIISESNAFSSSKFLA